MHNNEHGRIADSTQAQFLHPDSAIENGRYWSDQELQHFRRQEYLEKRIGRNQREIAAFARDTISLKYLAADYTLQTSFKWLSFVIKPDGVEAPPGWLSTCYREAEKERSWYWRIKEGVLRPEKIVKWVKKRGKKTGWRRIERDIELSPERSRGFFLAAQNGFEELAKELLVRLARFSVMVIHEETGGMLVLAVPVHAKPEALHIQPSWTGWTAPVRLPGDVSPHMACIKVGGAGHPNRLDSNLHRPLLGALAQHKMGLPLDDLTGRIDAAGGVMMAIDRKSRVNPPFDLRVRERIDEFIEEELKKPEFLPLAPFMQQSRAIYLARKEEQLALIKEISAGGSTPSKSDAVKKLREEIAKIKEKQEKELATVDEARASERLRRLGVEVWLAAVEAENAELVAKVEAMEASRTARDAAHGKAMEAESAARRATEAKLEELTAVNRGLVARVAAGEAALAKATGALQAAESTLASLQVDHAGQRYANTGFEQILAGLAAGVRSEKPDPETGFRPYLRVAVSIALPFLPKDLFNFEQLIRHVGRMPMDTALLDYAKSVGTAEAKDFQSAFEAAQTLPGIAVVPATRPTHPARDPA